MVGPPSILENPPQANILYICVVAEWVILSFVWGSLAMVKILNCFSTSSFCLCLIYHISSYAMSLNRSESMCSTSVGKLELQVHKL